MVETVRLVRICRWTAPQPHEVTRPCEWLGVNKLRGNYTMALNGRLGSEADARLMSPVFQSEIKCGCPRIGSRRMLRQPTQAKQKVVK